jgi:formiminotetrahydrofolate cyclodeaminase
MKNLSLLEFAKTTASKDPVPGGGSISALAGSLSAALAEMVSGLTLSSKKYEEVHEEMQTVYEKANKLCSELMDDIQRDSDAFTEVMDAFKLPKNTDEEISVRSEAIQAAFKLAAEIPMGVAQKAYSVMELSKIVVSKGNKNAVTDSLVSAMMARTAVLGALLNVKINLGSIKDEEYVADMRKRVNELEAKAMEKEAVILSIAKL